jgi:bifunctional non-homologous end joining protein LigD
LRKPTQTRFIARTIEGAVPSEMPGFVPPQLATLRLKPPKGDWLHEVKLDGYRIQVHLNKGRVTCFTRTELDWTRRFPTIVDAFDISVARAIFDGEVAVVKGDRTDFSELQADLADGRRDRLVYYAFDLLFLEGFDLRQSPLVERKRLLKMLFDETGLSSPVIYSEHFNVEGAELFERASRLGLEGIISKNPSAPYESDRSDAWVKVKCIQRGEFPVVGFDPEIGGIAALYLGKREGQQLVYAGKVGTGFSRTTSMQVRKKLEPLVTPEQKLTKKIRKPKARWVEPKYLADVEYKDITSEGLLRASSFKGLIER